MLWTTLSALLGSDIKKNYRKPHSDIRRNAPSRVRTYDNGIAALEG